VQGNVKLLKDGLCHIVPVLYNKVEESFVSLKLHIAFIVNAFSVMFAKNVALHVELLNLQACCEMIKLQKFVHLI